MSHDFSYGYELINTLFCTLWQKAKVFGQGQEDHFRHKKDGIFTKVHFSCLNIECVKREQKSKNKEKGKLR